MYNRHFSAAVGHLVWRLDFKPQRAKGKSDRFAANDNEVVQQNINKITNCWKYVSQGSLKRLSKQQGSCFAGDLLFAGNRFYISSWSWTAPTLLIENLHYAGNKTCWKASVSWQKSVSALPCYVDNSVCRGCLKIQNPKIRILSIKANIWLQAATSMTAACWKWTPRRNVILNAGVFVGIISSVRSSYSHPDLLLTQQHHHPTFSDHTGPQHWTFTFWATTAI